MEMPLLAHLRQTFSQPVVSDLPGEVRRQWQGSDLPQRLRRGDRVAVRMAVIPNTLELAELWVSPPLLEEARTKPHLQVFGELQPLLFDEAGNLEQERLFPRCVRARRRQKL